MASNIAGGTAFAAFGGVILWLSSDFPPAASVAADPALLPRAVGLLLVLCGVGIVLMSALRAAVPMIAARSGSASPHQPIEPEDQATTAVVSLIAGTAAYAWLALNGGYVTMTAAFLAAATLLLGGWPGRARALRLALLALAFSLVIHFLFSSLLNVPIPRTFLP